MTRFRPILFFLAGVVLTAGALGAVLAASGGDAEVRVSARRIDDGRVEVALQQTQDDGTWGERSLPEQRFLSADATPGQWHSSSSETIMVGAPGPSLADYLRSPELPDMEWAIPICVITHERPGDQAFWQIANEGAISWDEEHPQATVTLHKGATAEAQSDLVRQCIRDGAAAIVITLPDPEGVRDALAEAADAGLLVTSFNSGVQSYEDVGSIRHVSIDEFAAGRAAAARLTAHGVAGTILCVTHEPSNIGLRERCEGLEAGAGDRVERFSVADSGTADLDATRERIAERLRDDSNPVAAVVALNAVVSIAVRDAVAETGSEVVVATFDQTDDVLRALADGEILFAVDTLPWNQSYLALTTTMHTYSAWYVFTHRFGIDPFDIIGVYNITVQTRWMTKNNATTVLEIVQRLQRTQQERASGGGGRPGG